MNIAAPADRRVLIVGLGIGGISTAIALRRAGWSPVIVEKAAGRRSGGYFIGFSGAGKSAAQRLGILDRLHNRTATSAKTYEIDRAGRRHTGIGFADRPDRPWMMLRGDVEAAAYAALGDSVEIRYCTVPTAIEQNSEGVDVTLCDTAANSSTVERFELVVGADGLRSTVRRLTFGRDEKCLHRLNYMIAAFELPTELSGFTSGEGMILTERGRSFWVFPFSDHAPTALFTYRTDDIDAEFTASPSERIRQVYGPEPLGEILEEAITVLESSDQALFDSVEQVRLNRWHDGRVVLVGDAAWCVTLYAGMGVSAGIAGADLLGTMLAQHPDDLETALTAWEQQLRPFVEYYQQIGIHNRIFFNPATRVEKMRRSVMLLARRHPVAGRVLGRAIGEGKDLRMRNADIAAPDLATPNSAIA